MEIKLERLGDSENMKSENTYSVNFYQFFELAQQSETIDINEYIFDEFVIKKIDYQFENLLNITLELKNKLLVLTQINFIDLHLNQNAKLQK